MWYINSQIQEHTLITLNPLISTCNNFPKAKIKVFVSLGFCYLSGLHHVYMTPFLGLRVMKSHFKFDLFGDHDVMQVKLGRIRLFDLTNWPFTQNPTRINCRGDLKPEIEILGFYEDG